MLPADLAQVAFPFGLPPVAGLPEALDDVGDGRLAVMNAAGIDVQVLSVIGHGIQELAPHDAAAVAREANDRTAAAVTAHPDRFTAFALLPMSDPDAAAVELVRTHSELGMIGAMVHGQTLGRFLDDPAFTPVLAAAEHEGVPIYMHPAPPPPTVRDAYYSGIEPGIGASLATGAWGWHAECGMHVLRMVATGVFDRFPGLRVIVGHMGENLPFSLARAEQQLGHVTRSLSRSVTQTVLDHVVITTSGYVTEPPLRCALEVFGSERILFSVDHPFSDSSEATAFLANAAIDDDARAAISHRNAEALLHL